MFIRYQLNFLKVYLAGLLVSEMSSSTSWSVAVMMVTMAGQPKETML